MGSQGSSKALRSMVLAAVAALVGVALAGPSTALPVQIGEGDDTECLQRSSVPGDGQSMNDAVAGNFWVRRDTFSLDPEADCSGADVTGISVIVKTPLQVDSDPDWDDLDGGNDSFGDLVAAILALPEAEGFHPSLGGAAFTEGGSGAPTGAFANTFQSVRICLAVGSSISIASCLAGSPAMLTDIGGGYMIFTLELGEGFFLNFEGDESFDLVTIVHSDVLGPVPGNDLPEMLVGWRFVAFHAVPEPSLVLLLAPVLLLALRRRVS